MNIKRVKLEGSSLPWRFNESQLEEALTALPVRVSGTKNLFLKAHMGIGKRVRITPERGSVGQVSLYNIRDAQTYLEGGATYFVFKYHGVTYEIGTASPYLPPITRKKRKA